VGQQQERRKGCTCALCEIDALAFALNSLPALYCLGHHYGIAAQKIDPEKVKQAVEGAFLRVNRRPRHSPSAPELDPDLLRLRNFALEQAAVVLERLAAGMRPVCFCEECREDIVAYALNRVPPRSGVERRGVLRMPPHQMDFLRDELERILAKAAKLIAANPRHNRTAAE
jgi:hypothetical protein